MKRLETEAMAKLYREGYSCGEIARLYRVTRQAIRKRLVKAGVVMRGSRAKLGRQ